MAAGEVGEMLLRAPQHMVGYWNNPDGDRSHAANAWSGRTVGAHRRPRQMDADGFIFIVDRKKDLLKTSGYQVWPREIEEVLDDASCGDGSQASPAFPIPPKARWRTRGSY